MVKRILAEAGEVCEVDVDILHNTLCDLPAEKYIDLFHKMQMKIYGYPSPFANCGCGTLEDSEEK